MPHIDLGLALLSQRTERGRRHTLKEIAAWCGCSLQGIAQIERRALAKLRIRAASLRGEITTRKIDGQGFRVWRTK
jgi:hypothetical protein